MLEIAFDKAFRSLVLALCVLLSACSPRMDQLLDKLMGHNSQTVVLAGSPLSIGSEGVSLIGKESMKVLGSSANVCLVLKSDIGNPSQPEMDALIKESLGGAELSSTVRISSGQTFDLSCTGQAWREYGLMTPDEELSVRLSRGCESKLPVNADISGITIHASSPVRVLGVYWESTYAFDENSPSLVPAPSALTCDRTIAARSINVSCDRSGPEIRDGHAPWPTAGIADVC